jgi:hypothetical protein
MKRTILIISVAFFLCLLVVAISVYSNKSSNTEIESPSLQPSAVSVSVSANPATAAITDEISDTFAQSGSYNLENEILQDTVLVNESGSSGKGLFYLGMPKDVLVSVLKDKGIDYEVMESDPGESITPFESSYLYHFELISDWISLNVDKDAVSDIEIVGSSPLKATSTLAGLNLGDSFNQMVELYGNNYAVKDPSILNEDNYKIYVYKIDDRYLIIYFSNEAVAKWEVSYDCDFFIPKIEKLQKEMAKYNTNLLPNEKHAVCVNCIAELKDVLLEKNSISASPEEILGRDTDFYLKLGDTTRIDDTTYRLIEFGVTRKNMIVEKMGEEMGTQTVLYLQGWKGNNEISDVQLIYTASVGENITILLDNEIIKSDNDYYISIVDKLYTPETIVLHLVTFRYENNKWIPYTNTEELRDATWSLMIVPDIALNEIEISCRKIDAVDQYEYEYQHTDNRTKISALNDRNVVIGTLILIFKDGKWIVEKSQPAKSTADDPDFMDDMSVFPLKMDLDGDGTSDMLSIDLNYDFDDNSNYNKPTRIKLSIGKHEAIYESTWNDGIGMKIIDLDTEDRFLDICIFSYGTDVSVGVLIYRYTGKEIYRYNILNIGDNTSFSYDSKGMVYYNTFLDESDDYRYVHASYDYRNNIVSYVDVDDRDRSY